MFYWLLKYVILGPVLRLLFRPDVDGLDNVPATGPVILACNHLSFSDSLFTPLMVRRRVTFVAKAEYFTGRGLTGRLQSWFFRSTGTIPVDRSGGEAAKAALDTLMRVLRSVVWRASTPRAPDRPTAACTGGRPAWPGWPWKAVRSWCRWPC